MENKIRKLAKRDVVAKYLLFVAGIQISAAVTLFVNVYFVDVALTKFILILVAGVALGIGSFLSLMFAGEAEVVVKAGEYVLGTMLERDRDKEMNNKLDETVSMAFLGQRKRIDRIKAFFWSDVILSVLSIAITIAGKS